MQAIRLVNGGAAIVDDDDFERFGGFLWKQHLGYAVRHGHRTPGKQGPTLRLHRCIMNLKVGDPREVDHRNHNKLDCRKDNLRVCTSQQNDFNRRPEGGSSKFKGVTWDKVRSLWSARIMAGGVRLGLGRFKNEVDAAMAYNKAASRHFGEFAFLNKLEAA